MANLIIDTTKIKVYERLKFLAEAAGKDAGFADRLWESLLGLLSQHKAQFFLIKGHQTLKEGGEAANSKAFERFIKHNGNGFSFERFAQIVDYNNRCDALANVFIKECRAEHQRAAGQTDHVNT